jgi:molybdopterin-guanine dinucleotide biosynthesis protein A
VDGATRLRLPGWLLVGSTGRNSGKTEFACAAIQAVQRLHPVAGVKITAIRDGESVCPREGGGCGVCAALEGDFHIGEERGEAPGKDTSRLLQSGAHPVFWVRCRRERLRDAIVVLLPRLDGRLVVAESNSLAQAAEPDLFLMVQRPGVPVKPTAAEALPLADRLVASSGAAFDPHPRQLAVVHGRWRLLEASAAILAGGRSTRMGQDKGLLRLHGRTLIRGIQEQLQGQFGEILISTNTPERHSLPGARTVADRVPGEGPLMGIASAVEAARYPQVFVIACDIPVVHLATVRRMLALAQDFDCVIPVSARGPEPLFGVYAKSALPAMRQALAAGQRRVDAIFSRVRTHGFDLGPAPWYRNLNTREDVAAFLRSG